MNIKLDIQPVDSADIQIEQTLRRLIQSGELAPMQRLDSTAELAHQWKVTPSSVQKAMERLAADGWIERNRKRGTFIKRRTHRATIAVLIGPYLTDETATYWRALFRSIRQKIDENRTRYWSCRGYDGLDELHRTMTGEGIAGPAVEHLTTDLRSNRFIGAISLINEPEVDRLFPADFPIVRAGPTLKGYSGDIELDYQRFGHECMDFIALKGLRRIAYLRTIDTTLELTKDLDAIQSVAKSNQQTVTVHQLEKVIVSGDAMERVAYDLTLQLIEEWQKNNTWPEAILITDDIATRGVATALLQKQIHVPEKLLIVTLGIKGIHHSYGVPVFRYDLSTDEVAEAFLDLLWKRTTGLKEPALPLMIGGILSSASCRTAPYQTTHATA